jgi:hypothetical protein
MEIKNIKGCTERRGNINRSEKKDRKNVKKEKGDNKNE